MAEFITYGSYTFPSPCPLVAQGVDPVYVAGKVDHFADSIDLVGTITGENLSGLHLQKMQMISGLLSEFQTLNITNDAGTKSFTAAKPESISFDSSNLSTLLPYSVTFSSYSSGTFSEFYGIENPSDVWTFSEQDGQITEVLHSVSAKGVKIDSKNPFENARHFVTGRATGFIDFSLFQTGTTNAFLISRNEEVNKSSNTYSINENYRYSTSEDLITDSGITTCNTQISYDKDQGLSVSVKASVQGSITGNVDQVGLLHTGVFTSEKAQEVALNAVVSSLSDYESGLYTFISAGPKTSSFDIDTGTNKIDFNYSFVDCSNLDQEGNVLHTQSASVSTSKDEALVKVSVVGELKYNTSLDVFATGDPATGERFKELDAQYSGVQANSGFFNLAVEALKYFREDATGYHISGDYLNPTPLSKSIDKRPADSIITYTVDFDNKIDLSSGTLSGLQVNITDKKPQQLSGIVPSLGGFAKQNIMNRRAGEYEVSANCEASTGDMQTLKDVVSGHMTGIYTIAENSSVNDDTISYNTRRVY